MRFIKLNKPLEYNVYIRKGKLGISARAIGVEIAYRQS